MIRGPRLAMFWRKTAWRLYDALTRRAMLVPGVPLLVRKSQLGQRLDWLFRQAITARLPDNPMVTQGLTLHWDLSSGLVAEMAIGEYESATRLWLERFLGPGMTMVDLGAHIGYFSLIAVRRVGPSGSVYAFEPQPRVYDLLVKNIEANGFQSIIRPVKKAVSNAAGPAALFIEENFAPSASLYQLPVGSERAAVETTTLDAFFAAEGWPPVHLIKMDIEGAEKAALEGMRELAKRNHGLIKVIMEFNPRVQARAGVTPEELFETLLALGFQRFSAIRRSQWQRLSIPQNIPDLVSMLGPRHYLNLLCEM